MFESISMELKAGLFCKPHSFVSLLIYTLMHTDSIPFQLKKESTVKNQVK